MREIRRFTLAMGLLQIIRKDQRKKQEMRVLLLGLDNGGKSTLLAHLLRLPTADLPPTLGFNIRSYRHQDYTLAIWDIGGQRSLRPYWENYYSHTDAIIWVIDAAHPPALDTSLVELASLLKQQRLSSAALLIYANKQDIPGALSAAQIGSALNLAQLGRPFHIQACSAKPTQEGEEPDIRIWEGLDWLVDQVAQRSYYKSSLPDTLASRTVSTQV